MDTPGIGDSLVDYNEDDDVDMPNDGGEDENSATTIMRQEVSLPQKSHRARCLCFEARINCPGRSAWDSCFVCTTPMWHVHKCTLPKAANGASLTSALQRIEVPAVPSADI